MEIIFDGFENIDNFQFIKEKMYEASKSALIQEKCYNKNIEISVTFVDEEEIRNINKEFRNIDKVTDVLSFPQYNNPSEIPANEEVILGDVVICLEVCKRQSKEYGHSFERELLYLFVHSIFHLLGYDHMNEEERAQMRNAEEKVMKTIQIVREEIDKKIISDSDLFKEAKKIMANAYAPYSNFKVGAAILTDDNEIFTGVNIENSSYGATVCAERNAIFTAITNGKTKFKKIAIAASKGEAIPCGICRQVLFEFAPDIEIIIGTDKNNISKTTLQNIFTQGFELERN